MITDKNGENVSLQGILDYLVGTDRLDQAKSVMDFTLYPVKDDKTFGDPIYHLVASQAIVTQVSFMGPFTMVEVDFRDIGIQLLQQAVAVIGRYHREINNNPVAMVSTVTSLDQNATHILVLTNPLSCVRGFSEEGQGSTLMQLIYSTDNVGFTICNVNYSEIEAEIDREITELESANVTDEVIAAAGEDEDKESEMQQIFKPDFAPDFSEDDEMKKETVRVSGTHSIKVGRGETEKIKGVREVKEHGEEG